MLTFLGILAVFLYTLAMQSPFNSYLVTSLVKLVLFLGVPLLYFKRKLPSMREHMGLSKFCKLKIPALLGAGCSALIILGYLLLQRFFNSEQILSGLHNQGITKAVYPLVFIHIVIINSFLEEFFFRGFLFMNFYQKGKKWYAYIFSSVLFSIYHISIFQTWFSVGIVMLCLAGLIGAGLLFCEADRRCENIYSGWLIHLGANIGINAIGAYLFLFT